MASIAAEALNRRFRASLSPLVPNLNLETTPGISAHVKSEPLNEALGYSLKQSVPALASSSIAIDPKTPFCFLMIERRLRHDTGVTSCISCESELVSSMRRTRFAIEV